MSPGNAEMLALEQRNTELMAENVELRRTHIRLTARLGRLLNALDVLTSEAAAGK